MDGGRKVARSKSALVGYSIQWQTHGSTGREDAKPPPAAEAGYSIDRFDGSMVCVNCGTSASMEFDNPGSQVPCTVCPQLLSALLN